MPHSKICKLSQHISFTSHSKKHESVRCSAALALTGAWAGTSLENLYEELGWEALSSLRWGRCPILLLQVCK